jgi:hypothetical protein
VSKRESFLLRLQPEMLEALRRWADDDFRSVNSQIEFLLKQALERSGRGKPNKGNPGEGDGKDTEADGAK